MPIHLKALASATCTVNPVHTGNANLKNYKNIHKEKILIIFHRCLYYTDTIKSDTRRLIRSFTLNVEN